MEVQGIRRRLPLDLQRLFSVNRDHGCSSWRLSTRSSPRVECRFCVSIPSRGTHSSAQHRPRVRLFRFAHALSSRSLRSVSVQGLEKQVAVDVDHIDEDALMELILRNFHNCFGRLFSFDTRYKKADKRFRRKQNFCTEKIQQLGYSALGILQKTEMTQKSVRMLQIGLPFS